MNCWEFMECEKGGTGKHSHEFDICPAYPENGKVCATVIGTLCNGDVQDTHAKKYGMCPNCDFYRSEHYDKSYL